MRAAFRYGTAFVVLFGAAFVLSLGIVVGMFADPDSVFIEHFADEGNQVRGIAASFLLALGGLAFTMFADALSRDAEEHRTPLLITGTAAAGAMMLAAVAFATVPLSLWFGSLFEESPGLQEGQAVLPQFGYAALGMGAMLPAAVFIVLVARTPGLVPRWLSVLSYPLAALVAFTAVLFMPMFLFIGWVAAVAVTHRATPRRGVRGSPG